MVCLVASLFCTLSIYYHVHFARLRAYVDSLIEQDETLIRELDNLFVVNLTTPQAKEEEKGRLADKVNIRKKDSKWNKRREVFFSVLWTGLGWAARITFPLGLGLLTFFASKNM